MREEAGGQPLALGDGRRHLPHDAALPLQVVRGVVRAVDADGGPQARLLKAPPGLRHLLRGIVGAAVPTWAGGEGKRSRPVRCSAQKMRQTAHKTPNCLRAY